MDEQDSKYCPNCKSAMECCSHDIPIGHDESGGLMQLFFQAYMVDLFACPSCGKVELYTASFGVAQVDEKADYVTCPVCEARHSPLIGCPRCALHGRRSMPIVKPTPAQQEQPKPKKDSKPPWEKRGRRPPWEK